jgi:hypothetical protein
MILLFGCISPLTEPASVNVQQQTTLISSISFSCLVEEAEKWSLEVKTEGWSGGGFLWMAEPLYDEEPDTAGTYPYFIERHPFYSVGAEADGSADRLKLSLTAVSDWRDAAPGSSTRWLCADEERLSIWVEVLGPSGNAVADCEGWGIDAEELCN